jgi:F-type H+-transporting ATPase subunit b
MALLRVEPGLLIWLWIAFGIIIVVLRLTVWDRIVGGLDARASRIQNDLESARKAAEEQLHAADEARAKLEEAKHQAAVLVEQGRYQASLLREQLIAETRAQIEVDRTKAVREISQAREDALTELRQEVVSISLEIARAILNREVSEKDNRALVDELLEQYPVHN